MQSNKGLNIRVCSLPAHPSMSHILMMNNIREEDAGLGSGYCPSLLYPLRLGRSCKMANRRLRAALPKLSAPNKTGWKVTTNSVAASRFGQQKVSSRGEAMTAWREERRRKGEWDVGYGVRTAKKKTRTGEETIGYMTQLWGITGLNRHVLPFNPCSCATLQEADKGLLCDRTGFMFGEFSKYIIRLYMYSAFASQGLHRMNI